MAYQIQDSEGLSAVELIAERGLEALPQAVAALINEAMRVEREHHLGATRYGRNEDRCGYANGYKLRTLKMCMGALDLQIPRVREGGFYSNLTGARSALGTRIEAGAGADVRGRGFDPQGGSHHRRAVRLRGQFDVSLTVLGVLTQLKDRGLCGVKLFISDDHSGLKAARKAIFPSVPWQRCQFHLQQNAAQCVLQQHERKAVAEGIPADLQRPRRRGSQASARALHRHLGSGGPEAHCVGR